MPTVSPSSIDRPMRAMTPSSRATARFRREFPLPLMSEIMGARAIQLTKFSTATGT